jgi:hypothetical protein
MANKRRRKKRKAIHQCQCPNCGRHPHGALAKQHRAINRVLVTLDEKNRRRFVGLLAHQRGRGGVQALATITGMSRNSIRRGREEIRRTDRAGRVRQPGAGRPAVEKNIRRS